MTRLHISVRRALPALAVAALTSFDSSADVFSAIRDNDIEQLRSILQADPASANSATERGVSALGYAVVQQRVEAAYELVAAGADPDAPTTGSLVTALHRAADRGDADFVRLLLESGAKPSVAAANGFTALHFAARTNSQACVKLLVEAGADADARDTNGRTPLHIAAKYDATEAASALLSAGASPALADNYGFVPAALASDQALIDILGGVPEAPVAAASAQGDASAFFSVPRVAAAKPQLPAPEAQDEGESAESAAAPAESEDGEGGDGEQVAAGDADPVESWPENPFHDESLDSATRIRRFHADPGTKLMRDGKSYWGGLHKERFEGFGVLLAENERDRYEGMFRHGKKNGYGVFYYADGNVFKGTFRDDAPNGEGEFTFAKGGSVKGIWRRGLFWEGRGTFTSSTGAQFVGVWADGELVASRPID